MACMIVGKNYSVRVMLCLCWILTLCSCNPLFAQISIIIVQRDREGERKGTNESTAIEALEQSYTLEQHKNKCEALNERRKFYN